MTSGMASAAAVGPPPGMAVRLSSNESPFGPSPRVLAALRESAPDSHLYPDDQSTALRQAVADHEGVAVEQVGVGTGSSALLMDIVGHEVAARPGAVLAFEHAFVVYRLAARNAGATYGEVRTAGPATGDRDGYARDGAALLAQVDDDTRVVMIDNPGNPTGAHLAGDELRQFIGGVPDDVAVVVDEAYHHYAAGQGGYATVASLGCDHPRLLVVRTFSKAFALAGLRIGYVVGPAELVSSLDAWRVRFNVNSLAQRAAIAALGDTDHTDRTVTATRDGRARMAAGLRELGVPVSEGLGNFVTVELGQPASPVVAAYGEHGVGVRPLAPYGMNEQIRVTVGTPDEVDAFLAASKDVLADVAARS